MASAAAWSVEEGVGAPMVCQADFLAFRNSALEAFTVDVELDAVIIIMRADFYGLLTSQWSVVVSVAGAVAVPAQGIIIGDDEAGAGTILSFPLLGLILWL